MTRYQVGQMVTVMPPYDDDPYILAFQHFARVAEVRPDGYMVVLGATWPPNKTFGPFPAYRLREGWRDPADGSWWVRT